jgi:NADPH:quinone reductase
VDPTLPVRACMTANLNLRFVLLYGVPPDVLRAAAQEVTAAAAAGAITSLPLHRFSFDDVAAAHEAVESGTIGKVIIDIA